MFLQKRHIIVLNIRIDIDIFSMFMSIIENCIKQIFRCKQSFRFVDLINNRFKINFIDTFLNVLNREFFECFRNKFSKF